MFPGLGSWRSSEPPASPEVASMSTSSLNRRGGSLTTKLSWGVACLCPRGGDPDSSDAVFWLICGVPGAQPRRRHPSGCGVPLVSAACFRFPGRRTAHP